MITPVFGLNIPSPKIKIHKEHLEKYADLYRGIRDRRDTVSWRTLIVTIREILGQTSPDYKKVNGKSENRGVKLIKGLVDKTYLEHLVPEIEYAVGIKKSIKKRLSEIDLLILSGRHFPEPILWNLADFAKKEGKKVAVINPVGHYNDEQTRVIGPYKYFHKIKKLVFISSTQSKQGGNISVLANVIKLLRNSDLAVRVGGVEVIIPMFGGSRGHRFGQSQEVGYEVMEAGFNAQMISLIARDILKRLQQEIKTLPKIRFSSVDIHNSEFPAKTFNEFGFEFVSIKSASALADGVLSLLKAKKIKAPLKLVACDKGAVPRTIDLAQEIIKSSKGDVRVLQIIYIKKNRHSAGVVSGAQIERIEEWKKVDKKIQVKNIRTPKRASFVNTVIIYSDDMIDTGGTAEKDLAFISNFFPNSSFKIFTATHPVFSKGFGAIKRIGADAFVVGNTLAVDGLAEINSVEVVDFAPVLYKYLFQL